jgi:hypothetical protein
MPRLGVFGRAGKAGVLVGVTSRGCYAASGERYVLQGRTLRWSIGVGWKGRVPTTSSRNLAGEVGERSDTADNLI